MTRSVAAIDADLVAARAGRASTARRVKFSDREIEYKSDSDYASHIKDLEAERAAALAASGSPIVRHIYGRQSDRGY